MSSSTIDMIHALINAEVERRMMKYVQIISKKHDISLKLLLQDIPLTSGSTNVVCEKSSSSQCLGVTAKGIQCTFTGKNSGYCTRHVSQRKEKVVVVPELVGEKNIHVGHTIQECMFLKGCPACEKTRSSKQNLLIDI